MKPELENLGEVIEFTWNHLATGCEKGSHPWHCGTICTTDGEGVPDARIVVLRGVDGERGALTFHTDARSPKCADLGAGSVVTWLFYDAELGAQLRVRGVAEFAPPDETRAAWDAIPDRCLKSYATELPPGTPLDARGSGLPENWDDHTIVRADFAWTAEHFRVVRVRAERLDFLLLRAAGHLRARFFRSESGGWSGTWVTP